MNYYLHINENISLEACLVEDLIGNRLNGNIVCTGLDKISPSEACDIIRAAQRVFMANFLIVSLDPFLLHPVHYKILSNIDMPKGLIVCDTHHGSRPLSRMLEIMEYGGVSSVILRFNQRHERIFRTAGFWSGSTVLSPDLEESLVMTREYDDTGYYVSQTDNVGIFIGGVGTEGTHRFEMIKKFETDPLRYRIRRIQTKSKWEMLRCMREYKHSINFPLNGDYNRRFIESFIANRCVVTERLPKSQREYPYSRLEQFIVHVRDAEDSIEEFGKERPELYRLAPREAVKDIVRLQFDKHTLRAFVDSLCRQTSKRRVASDGLKRLVFCYEKLQDMNLRAKGGELEVEVKLVARAIAPLYDAEDEFYRLFDRFR